MKLRDDDKKWFADEIARQLRAVVDSFQPHGWRRLVHLLRELGPLAASIGIVLTLLGITATAVYFAISESGKNSEFRGSTSEKLKNIDTRLAGIDTTLLALRAAQAANQPTDRKNIADARAILDAAKRSAIKLPINDVERSGKAFIDASSKEPAAWDAAQAFLDYRSILNAASMPTGQLTQASITHYTTDNLLNPGVGALKVLGTTDASNAAQLRHISGPDVNQGIATQPSFLIYDNATFLLDTMYLRRVIFRNSHIIYKGGPIVLQEVYFINCTFEIERHPVGQSLANAILSSAHSVTFKSG